MGGYAAVWCLCAQVQPPRQPLVTVPFVGCKSYGQTGESETPEGATVAVPISAGAANRLAYCRSAFQEVGIRAHGGGTASDCPALAETCCSWLPRKLALSGKWHEFSRAAIVLSYRSGDTTGRFDVARVIAQLFPAYMKFVADVRAMFTDSGRVSARPLSARSVDLQEQEGRGIQNTRVSGGLRNTPVRQRRQAR